MKRNLWIFFGVFCGVTAISAKAETVLWRIGQPDRSASEFALTPNLYTQYTARFPEGCFYIVGVSDPQTDWSYVLPGPEDNWAQSRTHQGLIRFALQQAPGEASHLQVAFVDNHQSSPPLLCIRVNEFEYKKKLPAGGSDDTIQGDYAKGKPALIDIEVPASSLREGNNLITITNDVGSWCIFDSIVLKTPENVSLAEVKGATEIIDAQTMPYVLRGPDGSGLSWVRLSVLHASDPVQARIRMGTAILDTVSLKNGVNTIDVKLPAVTTETAALLELLLPGDVKVEKRVTIQPVRKWEVYLIHQTHLDIGYTHPQEEVLKLQVDHIRKAMEYIEASKDFPPEAQFKWHPEGMWAVEEFLRTADESEKAMFIEQARAGKMHLDAFYAQAMTCIDSDEELFELLASAKQFERRYTVPIVSATTSDVPGFAWGLMPTLAQNGVRYFSVGPNTGHRIGHVYDWADKPYWWQSPCGQYKVLFWMAGRGYSYFHRKPLGHEISPEEILPVLKELQEKGYPYDMAHLRYNIGTDNGPPNPALPDAVVKWNEKYLWPKLIISTNTEMFSRFEKRYGDQLPVMRGDFTGHWEDGAASTAADTALNRRTRETLVQAQTFWTLRDSATFPFEDFQKAWTDVIMYDEHTWGAHNSISDPDGEFAVRQAVYKQKFALDAAARTEGLMTQSLSEKTVTELATVDIYNASNWVREDLVLLTPEQSKVGDCVADDQGRTQPSQRLADGSLAFIARNVPALGARRYHLKPGQGLSSGSAKAAGNRLSNAVLQVEIDPASGAIRSFTHKDCATDFVRTDSSGLNDYLYIIGRDAKENRQSLEGPVAIRVEDAGPLVATVVIESNAPGCKKLTRRLRLIDGLDTLDIVNLTDKLKERRPESVFFGFPLNIPEGQWRIDAPWAMVRPEIDQLQGANRNFYTLQRWADLSNNKMGLTIVSVDAPMFQFDPIVFTRPYAKEDWRSAITPSSTLWSWVMNNHWETNYKADQEGVVAFRYVLRPYAGAFQPLEAQQLARGVFQPLAACSANPKQPVFQDSWIFEGDEVIVSSIKPIPDTKGYIVRLFNATEKPITTSIGLRGRQMEVRHCTPIGEPLEVIGQKINMKPLEVMNIRMVEIAK